MPSATNTQQIQDDDTPISMTMDLYRSINTFVTAQFPDDALAARVVDAVEAVLVSVEKGGDLGAAIP